MLYRTWQHSTSSFLQWLSIVALSRNQCARGSEDPQQQWAAHHFSCRPGRCGQEGRGQRGQEVMPSLSWPPEKKAVSSLWMKCLSHMEKTGGRGNEHSSLNKSVFSSVKIRRWPESDCSYIVDKNPVLRAHTVFFSCFITVSLLSRQCFCQLWG